MKSNELGEKYQWQTARLGTEQGEMAKMSSFTFKAWVLPGLTGMPT